MKPRKQTQSPRWFVLQVKPRNELKVSEKLQKLGIEAYAPAYVEVRQWSDRRKKVRVPYFASYVFVRLPERERDRAFCHPGVLRYLFLQGKPALVREEELQMIRTYLEGREKQSVLVERLSEGDTVVLLRGPLKDTHAHIEQVAANRVRLVLPVLGYKITAKLSDVAPAEAS